MLESCLGLRLLKLRRSDWDLEIGLVLDILARLPLYFHGWWVLISLAIEHWNTIAYLRGGHRWFLHLRFALIGAPLTRQLTTGAEALLWLQAWLACCALPDFSIIVQVLTLGYLFLCTVGACVEAVTPATAFETCRQHDYRVIFLNYI